MSKNEFSAVPGSTTLADIAGRANVSVATVSFILNNTPGRRFAEKTRRKVIEIANELKYSPNISARNLKTQSGSMISVAVRELQYMKDPYFAEFMSGLVFRAAESGYSIHICSTIPNKIGTGRPGGRKGIYYKDYIQGGFSAGLIINDLVMPEDEVRELVETGFPVVLFDKVVDGCSSVIVDYDSAIRTVINRLVRQGHRRIVGIFPEPVVGYNKRVINVFEKSIRDAGIDVSESYVKTVGPIGDDPIVDGDKVRDVVNSLMLDGEPPTVVLVTSRRVRTYLTSHLKTLKIAVPRDISVFGGMEIEFLKDEGDKISCFRLDEAKCGELAVDLLLKQINVQHDRRGSSRKLSSISVDLDIIWRESTAFLNKPE